MSASTLLTEVETALSAVLKGQSYSIGGRTLTRADLNDLKDWRLELQQEVARESGGGIQVNGITPID